MSDPKFQITPSGMKLCADILAQHLHARRLPVETVESIDLGQVRAVLVCWACVQQESKPQAWLPAQLDRILGLPRE